MISSPAIQSTKKQSAAEPNARKPLEFNLPTVCLLLAAIVMLSYWKSLQCFFFADDLLCLDYLHRIFNGEPQLFLERMISPWQDPSISLLYRPLADLSLAIDYAIWRSNPLGYHLTNMLLHLCASISCFVFVDTVLQFGKIQKTTIPAFLSAAIFAAYPLHVEPVLWICCRTDLAATALILFSLSLSIRIWHCKKTIAPASANEGGGGDPASDENEISQPGSSTCSAGFQFASNNNFSVAGIMPASIYEEPALRQISYLAYMGALMFKESVACALAVLLLYLLLFPPERSRPNSSGRAGGPSKLPAIFQASIPILKFLTPFIAITICYLGIRFIILGTPVGGYTGGLGAALNGSWQTRIFDPDIPVLLALAANVAVFKDNNAIYAILHSLFFLLAAITFIRIPSCPWSSKTGRFLIFFASATACTMAPTFQVAGIPPTLTNSRIFYLASSFFIPLVTLAIYPLCEHANEGSIIKRIRVASTTALSALACIYLCMCNASIDPWIDASKTLCAIQREARNRIEETRKLFGSRATVMCLNIPATIGGAHLIYEFRELTTLLGPAFYPTKHYSRALRSLDEYPDFMAPRMQSLRSYISENQYHKVFWFSHELNELLDCRKYSNTISNYRELVTKKVREIPCEHKLQKAYVAAIPQTYALSSDQIAITVNFKSFPGRPVMALALSDGNRLPSDRQLFFVMLEYGKQGIQKFIIPTSVLRKGVDLRTSRQLYVRLSDCCQVQNVELIPGSDKAACRFSSTQEVDPNGSYSHRMRDKYSFHLDARTIKGATGLYLEIGKPDHFLSFASINAFVPQPSQYRLRSWNLGSTIAEFKIDPAIFGKPALYEVRACATDPTGKLMGYFSDPVRFDFRKDSSNHRRTFD